MKKREDKMEELNGHSPIDNVSGEFPLGISNKTVRYSDEDLKEFREIVLAKLAEAKNDYDLLKGTLTRKYDNGTDDTAPSFKLAEEASDAVSKEEIALMALRHQKFMENLQNALVRIENKTYGICRISGKLIAKERLKAVPHTTLCIDAKLEMSRLN